MDVSCDDYVFLLLICLKAILRMKVCVCARTGSGSV